MIECKACGGPLRFDIASQKMLCPYCGQSYEPELFSDQGSAEEYSDEYEATIFTCPQCGGELGSTETSAAEFCSFCGAPTVLESRLSRMKRPQYIIPFKMTKEECKKKLKNHLQKSFFVPKDFKDSEVESFRGIYMPTWNYNIVQKGNVTLKYDADPPNEPVYRYHYQIKGKVDALYHGIPHDASETFADRISETLEPYHYKERKAFLPSYLAGFFSDIQDVDSAKYEEEALALASEHTYNKIKSQISTEDGGHLKELSAKALKDVIPTKVSEPDNTLIPVWFLSYRKGNRIAYAAINGESGKVVTDTPIAIWKVWLMALVMAVPIFFGLNLCMTLVPSMLLVLSMIMLILTNILYYCEMEKIIAREKNIYFERAVRAAAGKEKNPFDNETKPKKKFSFKKAAKALKIGCMIPILLFAALIIGIIAFFLLDIAMELLADILWLPFLLVMTLLPIFGYAGYKDEPFFHGIY